jgi:hypothetical protein
MVKQEEIKRTQNKVAYNLRIKEVRSLKETSEQKDTKKDPESQVSGKTGTSVSFIMKGC